VKSRFTYIGATVIEVTIDGDSVTWNVLPAEQVPDESSVSDAELPQPEQDSAEVLLAASSPTKTKRSVGKNIAAFIRGTWTFLIAIFVEGGTYLVSNMTSLHIPPGLAIGGGALLQGAIYATKKRAFPDTVL
jgi:hypothetical protein